MKETSELEEKAESGKLSNDDKFCLKTIIYSDESACSEIGKKITKSYKKL